MIATRRECKGAEQKREFKPAAWIFFQAPFAGPKALGVPWDSCVSKMDKHPSISSDPYSLGDERQVEDAPTKEAEDSNEDVSPDNNEIFALKSTGGKGMK